MARGPLEMELRAPTAQIAAQMEMKTKTPVHFKGPTNIFGDLGSIHEGHAARWGHVDTRRPPGAVGP